MATHRTIFPSGLIMEQEVDELGDACREIERMQGELRKANGTIMRMTREREKLREFQEQVQTAQEAWEDAVDLLFHPRNCVGIKPKNPETSS